MANIANLNEHWNGHTGLEIETFLKETLKGKAGIFHHDDINNRYLIFTDEESKEAYLADQSKTELLLGVISGGTGEGGSTGEYRVAVNLLSSMYNAVSLGSKGHYIRFTFDVLNELGMPTGEPVVVTYKIARGGNTSEYKEVYRYGSNVAFNVDKYINEGTNIVTINIMGQTSLVSTTFAVTFDVINITLSDYLDISKVYNLSNNGTDYMEIPYEVSGTYTKLMEWYIDGVQLEFDRTDDEILETVPVSRTKTIELSNLSQGRHNLQFRVGSKINGEMFYSDVLYRDFFVYTGANDNFMMGVATAIPSSYGILTDGLVIHDMVQYVDYNLKVASYSPINTAKTDIAISLDNELVGNVTSSNGIVTDVIIVATTDGSKTLKLSTEETEYLIPTEVSGTDMTLSEITSGLKLNFTARGRNNNSSDKETWTDGTTTATLTGFQWNNQSGWVNNRLEISKNAELHIEYAPLSSHNNGKTIEVEWSSKNVSDENAVLCDLRNDKGTGILITATSVVVTSANNETIERRYKSDENVRISVVMNPNRGTNKGLTFIYINGVISGAINVVEGDNYISNKDIIFKGSTGAIVSLKSIRVYDVALSTEQILNNFNLYRDTLSEMLDVYNRNSIYDGNLYDTSKMASRLPVMIVTGDIPTLENTNDKDTQIIVDIEYINMQDTTRNFTMKNAAMRPQGTSSMGYPKKNFRIYTNKIDSTILTVNGKEVEDKLYSFKDNAIPVDCWCLKADYAESSGTHNVGIARMWGDAFKNAQVTVDLGVDNPHNLDNAYALRTTAQQKAINNGYKYDVRTTIDGFPILLFYRRTPESDIIFLGKYNFNNDKSTEKVFGFTDIPGFDNTRMQCWEVLNNGNSIGLFTDISDFYNDVFDSETGKTDKGWKFAFESRYPNTKTPKTDDLYNFASWVNGVNGEAERFAEEKWNHLDVYKVAGYYCYLMRHGAADQFVKNAMLTSEDGEHFYFILYDNDTINGLNNIGEIAILPTDNRESVYADGSYKFAGPDSVLWNLLEKDEEFTQIVQAVDNALYSAGISYKNAISMFDGQQADKWVERVYNLDAEYKYISPYTSNGTDNLSMLQGDREVHRKWWLSNRYSLYDSLFVSGAYKSKYVEIKCIDGTMPTQNFSVKSGYPLYYGYGINGKLRQRTDTPLEPNHSFTFSISEKVNLGDPIAIYGAPHIKELDLSTMSDRIAVLQLAGVYDDALGTKLEVLKLGSSLTENVTLKEISGIKSATALTHLDVTNMKGLTAIDLSNNMYLKELKASGTNIAGAAFATGAPVELLELPKLNFLTLKQLPLLTTEGLKIEDIKGINYVNITECPKISNSFSWVWNWYNSKTTADEECTLIMDNIDWSGTGVTAQNILRIANVGTLSLQGKVTIPSITLEEVIALREKFGDSIFNNKSSFWIDAPAGMFLVGPTEVLEGESAKYEMITFGDSEIARAQYKLSSSYSDVTIDSATGLLTTVENGTERTLEVILSAIVDGALQEKRISLTKKKRVYPQNVTIIGNMNPSLGENTYKISTPTQDVTGNYETTWSLTESDDGEKYAEIVTSDNNTCIINVLKTPLTVVNLTLSAVLKKVYNQSVIGSPTLLISIFDYSIAETDPEICRLFYEKGRCANAEYITKEEAKFITDSDLVNGSKSIFYGNRNIQSFEGFKHFTNVRTLPSECFLDCNNMRSITLPEELTKLDSSTFKNCTSLVSIILPNNITYLGDNCFVNCGLKSIIIESKNSVRLGSSCFNNCSKLESIYIEKCYFSSFAFSNCKSLKEVVIGSCENQSIGTECFSHCTSLEKIVMLNNEVLSIGHMSFSGCNSLVEIPSFSKLKSIGYESFKGCNVLEYLYISKSTTSIDYNSFNYCNSLSFDVSEENQTYKSLDGVLFSKDMTTLCYYCKSKIQPEYIIPNGVVYLKQYCFNTQTYLKDIVLSESVTSIGDYAFYYCKGLTSISIPTSVTSIGDYAFRGCSGLTSVTIPNGVTSIGEMTFADCLGLTSISIPNSVTSIRYAAFSQCSGLTSISIPNNVTSIGDRTFSYCANLRTIYCLSITAPTLDSAVFGNNPKSYTGRNTYDTKENKLYVPQGATGYDTGQWLDPLCNDEKCGFTLVYSE